MATDQPALTVLLIVDPDGWLHEVPRHLFTEWCKVKGIDRWNNLLRACNRREKGGHHFSNETADPEAGPVAATAQARVFAEGGQAPQPDRNVRSRLPPRPLPP